MKIKKVFALALATSLVLLGVSAFADDNYDLDDRYEAYEFDDDDYLDRDDDDDDDDYLDRDDDDDDDRKRRTVRFKPEQRIRLRAAIENCKKQLDFADRVVRANKNNPRAKKLAKLVENQRIIIRKLERLVG